MTDTNTELVVNAINDAHGTELEPGFLEGLGRETLKLEHEFNKAAGFVAEDDELPEFFYDEPLGPTDKIATYHSKEIHQSTSDWWKQNAQ